MQTDAGIPGGMLRGVSEYALKIQPLALPQQIVARTPGQTPGQFEKIRNSENGSVSGLVWKLTAKTVRGEGQNKETADRFTGSMQHEEICRPESMARTIDPVNKANIALFALHDEENSGIE